MVHPSTITIHHNQNSCYTPTSNNNNNNLEQIDQRSQGANNGGSYRSTTNGNVRNNNDSLPQWSTGNNGDLSSMNDNSGVYGTLSNSVSSSSSVYPQNEYQSMFSLNGFNQQAAYSHTNYPKHHQSSSSYGLLSSQSTGNVYGSGAYPSSSTTIPSNDIQSSSTSLNQYATANLPNGQNPSNYEANMSYAPYYSNSYT